MGNFAIQRKSDKKYYRGGRFRRWTRFACFAQKCANPTAAHQFFVPMFEKQGIATEVVWVRDKARGKEMDRLRENLVAEHLRGGSGGEWAGGFDLGGIDQTAATVLETGEEDGLDRIAVESFVPELQVSEEWKLVDRHTELVRVGANERPAIELRWGNGVAYILLADVDDLDRRCSLHSLREFVEFLLVTEKERATEELEAWQEVSIDANRALDAFLRILNPNLPEHYGMPLDGVRMTIEYVRAEEGGLRDKMWASWLEDVAAGRPYVTEGDAGWKMSLIGGRAVNAVQEASFRNGAEAYWMQNDVRAALGEAGRQQGAVTGRNPTTNAVEVIADPVEAYLAGRQSGLSGAVVTEGDLVARIRKTVADTRECCALAAETLPDGHVDCADYMRGRRDSAKAVRSVRLVDVPEPGKGSTVTVVTEEVLENMARLMRTEVLGEVLEAGEAMQVQAATDAVQEAVRIVAAAMGNDILLITPPLQEVGA